MPLLSRGSLRPIHLSSARPLSLNRVDLQNESSDGDSVVQRLGAVDKKEKRESGLTYASDLERPISALPRHAKVVICGGGAQGAAIAYKLAQRGLGPDTVLLDQGVLGGGTTWHSSGLIGLLKPSPVESKLTQISKNLYLDLQHKEGFYTGWKECGSLLVAQTDDRMQYFKRIKSESVARKIDCEVISPDDAGKLCPLIETQDLKGGLWVPGDGVANPFEICFALSHLAARKGVKIVENCKLEEVLTKDNKVSGVKTNQGTVLCESFVNTAGFWARHIGTLSSPRVQIPMHPAEHYYLHTKPIPDMPAFSPVVRDPDGHIYFRENGGRILGGGFEPVAKPAFEDGHMPTSSKSRQLPVDWDHFYVLLEGLLKRVPSLNNAVLETLTNGPEAFSPDGNWIMGQAPEIENYFVAVAMRSIGAGAAGGVGEVIASYIAEGRAPFDMYNLDIQRFLPMHNNRKFLRERVHEVPGKLYAIPYPFQEFRTGRAQRTTPIFPKLRAMGARFNQVMGYERAMYFKKEEAPLELSYFGLGEDSKKATDPLTANDSVSIAETKTFFKPPWFKEVEEEFYASRENVSVCDYSSFAKFDLWSSGDEVVEFLQKMCSNDIDMPIGHIKHTGMQNRFGGYENDCSVARLNENRYMLMSPSIQQMRSYTWMKTHLPSDGSVYLQDVTSLYTTLCVMGPKAPELMSRLTDVDLDSKAFPFFTCRHMDVSCSPEILTMNLTHTGELGYVLYIPSEFAVEVYESILEAGKDLGITNCGYFAMRALRIEKFYAFWGQDLDSTTTPMECGRAFRVKMNKDIDFIGRRALEEQQHQGAKKILVMLILDDTAHNNDSDPWPWGGEPIYRNGQFVGTVTTTSFGFSLRKHIGLGFVRCFKENGEEDIVTTQYVRTGSYEIEIAGKRFPATVRLNPPVLPVRGSAEMQQRGIYEATRHEK